MNTSKPYPSLPQAWGIFGIYLAASIGAGLAVMVIHEALNAESMSLGNVMGYTISMLFVIWFAWRNKTGGKSVRIFYFNKIPALIYPLIIILTLSLAVVLDPITNLLPIPEFIEELFSMLATKDIYTFLMVCLIGPVLEELLFRGIILEGFLHRYNPVKAIFWSAFLFGLFHMNPWQFIPGFFSGIILAWIYMKTRSLVPVILIHIVNNSLSYFVMFIYGADIMTFRDVFTDSAEYYALFISAIALLLICLFILYRILKSRNPFPIINNQT
jgi:membrane protease YdiL (CAAX protease family)